MKKWLLALCVLIPGTIFGNEELKQFSVSDFSGGLNTQFAPHAIKDNQVQDALNVYFDEDIGAVGRNGFSVCGSSGSYSFSGAWSYTDTSGINWLIVRSSESIIAANDSCDFSTVIATVTATDQVNATKAFGNIYFVDRTQGVYYFDGTSTSYISGSPQGRYIVTYRQRLAVAGAAFPNSNTLYLSEYLDGTNWTVGSLSTDPVEIPIGLFDAQDEITGLFSGLFDVLLIFKNRSIDGLYGFDSTDFDVRSLTKEVGTVDHRSIQPYLGGVVFASQRGIEFFDLVKPTLLSDAIKDKMQRLSKRSVQASAFSQTTQSQFEEGSIAPTGSLSTTIDPGAITVSSFSYSATIDSDFDNGSYSGLESNDDSISLEWCVSPNCDPLNNGDFETGDLTNWTEDSSSGGSFLVSATSGLCGGSDVTGAGTYVGRYNPSRISYSITAQAVDLDGNVLLEFSPTCGTQCDLTSSIYCDASLRGKRFKFRVKGTTVDGDSILSNDDSYIWSTYLTGSSGACLVISCTNPSFNPFFFETGDMSNPISSGSYTSEVFNMGVDNSTITFNMNWTVATSTPDVSLQTSNSSSGPWTEISQSTGVSVAVNRYVRIVSTITTGSTEDGQTTIDDFDFVSKSSGTYYSPVHNANNLTSWGTLDVTSSGNGVQTFYMRSSTSSFTILSSTPAWTQQNANTIIGISTGTYFQLRDDFEIISTTESPTLESFTINWFEGAVLPPMASVVYKDRYWISMATNTDTTENEATLVLSPGPVWTAWDISAGAFVIHRDQPYHTNNSGNGDIYIDDIGSNDDGVAIHKFVKTKRYAIGNITTPKVFDSLTAIAKNLGSYTMNVSYAVNGSTHTYSLDDVELDEQTGIVRAKLPFPLDSDHPNEGNVISITFENNETGERFHVFGGVLNYRERMPQ